MMTNIVVITLAVLLFISGSVNLMLYATLDQSEVSQHRRISQLESRLTNHNAYIENRVNALQSRVDAELNQQEAKLRVINNALGR